jgi:hypothetical protein
MQSAIMKALCANARTRPGGYRVVVQYWLDATGRIVRSRLIGSSGNAERDGTIAAALLTVTLGQKPGDMPQPVTMVIEPVASDDKACPGGTAIRSAAE